MCREQNKAIVRRYFQEVWNKGDLGMLDDIISPAFSGCGSVLSGPEAIKLYISAYLAAFPKTRFSILSLTAIGEDKVAVCWASRGTHKGLHSGCAGTPITGLSVYRLADGKIVEAWATSDEIGSMRAMGITTTWLSDLQ